MNARSRWDLLLLVLTALCAGITIIGFGTGRAEFDIIEQFRQVVGQKQMSDWHPPIIAVVWKGLYGATGWIGSLFAFSVILYFCGVLLIARSVHRRLGSRVGSLAVIAVSVSPWAYSQINTPWKDTILTGALLVACGCAMHIRRGDRSKRTVVLALLTLVVLIFATLVRKNAIAAVVPICFYLAWQLWPIAKGAMHKVWARRGDGASSRRRRYAAWIAGSFVLLFTVGGGAVVIDAGIAKTWNVKETHQEYQVMLDDVMFSVPEDELNEAAVSQQLKDRLNTAREQCYDNGEYYDAYWNCFGKGIGGDYEPIAIAHRNGLKKLWRENVITHPGRYISYRWSVYRYYLTTSMLVYLEQPVSIARETGFGRGPEPFESAAKTYVKGFSLTKFDFTFKPWFWLVGSVLVMASAWVCRRGRAAVFMLASSAFLYMAAYFPVIPEAHFRYTHWPVVAVLIGLTVALSGYCGGRRKRPAEKSDGPL